jgi:hypothetical protein
MYEGLVQVWPQKVEIGLVRKATGRDRVCPLGEREVASTLSRLDALPMALRPHRGCGILTLCYVGV